jgi:hypothetical protein
VQDKKLNNFIKINLLYYRLPIELVSILKTIIHKSCKVLSGVDGKTRSMNLSINCRSSPNHFSIWDFDNMTTQFDNQDSSRLADQIAYDPNNLLDSLIEKLHLKNDAALSRALEVAPPVISKIRHRRLPVGASLLIRMHEVSELSIRELRILMGDRREKFRISDKQFKPKQLGAMQ